MGEHIQVTVHLTIKFDQEVPEDVSLAFESLKDLEDAMQEDLLQQIRKHIVSETDEEVENLDLLAHVDISLKD